ncbi:LON peptidase substrate-binding domain-containing protein [Telluribacter humicola]|uniref:LON peptidase substrate-binding domain-containing protein n=1 Tax=Telluribacter humicola TaxID=1720261 RepID=UPI001A970DC3|nr:LON peptidase substrate-binding domain-containing protein [Telluribacter humicola]
MTPMLPLFPLNLVVYPGEKLNLHIFELRYRQLIDECLEENKTFGIPAFLNDRLPGYGTEVEVVALHKRYDDGRMDISTRGLRVFQIDTFNNPMEDKLYAGGEVIYTSESTDLDSPLPELTKLLDQLYNLLSITVEYQVEVAPFSFQVAHKVGMSLDDEYELLTIPQESERQLFLIQHLRKVLPVVADMEQTKARIRLNGHFKNLDPLNF